MLTAILKGISEILKDALHGVSPPGDASARKADEMMAYVKSAKAMLDNCIKELEKGDTTHLPPSEIPPGGGSPGTGREPGLDAVAQQAKDELEA